MKKSNNRVLIIERFNKSLKSRIRGYSKAYAVCGSCGGLERLPIDFLTRVEYYQAYRKAGALVDELFKEYLDSGEISVLDKAMRDERAGLIVKKQLLRAMKDIFLSFISAEKLIREYDIKEGVDLVPNEFPFTLYQLMSKKGSLSSAGIAIPGWFLKKAKRKEALKNAALRFLLVFYPLFSIFLTAVKRGTPKQKARFKYGMFLWDTALELPVPPCVDLLIDDQNIRHADVLYFIDNRINENDLNAKIKSKKYNYWYFKEEIGRLSLFTYLRDIIPGILKMSGSFFLANSGKLIVTQSYFYTLIYSIRWQVFFSGYHVEKFIYAQEVGNIQRVLCQKPGNSKNIFVFLSTSFNLTSNENGRDWGDSDYSFMIYDTVASNRMSNDYFKEHHNRVGKYLDLGVFYSDLVYKIKNDLEYKSKLKAKFGIPSDKTILGFFDTGIGRMLMFKEDEGLQMLTDVLRLLDSDDRYFMIYKARDDSDFSPDSAVGRIFNKLINHKRLFYANKYIAGDYHRPQFFMGISDLVIGAFGSSVPMEAVAGGVRTVCYTPAARFNNGKFLINTFPRFCPGNYADLKEFSDYWINRCAERDFLDFQEQYIKKHVDSHCDGKALNRLYALLKDEN